MSMQNLLFRDDNEPCIQEFSIENLVEQAVSMMDESDDRKSAHAASDPDEDSYVKPPSIEEQLDALSITNWIIQDRHCADKDAIRGLRSQPKDASVPAGGGSSKQGGQVAAKTPWNDRPLHLTHPR